MGYPWFPLEQKAVSDYSPLRGEVVRDLDLYVAPGAAAASDSNPGSLALPLATFAEVQRRLARIALVNVGARVVVHLASGQYEWAATLGPIQLRGPIAIVGDGAGQPGDDGFTVLQAPAAAAAGTGLRVIVDPVGGLTVNALVGKTIEVLSGAAVGDRRQIRSNTATDILPVRAFTAAVAPGDSFRIVESGIVITLPDATPSIAALPAVSGVGTPADPTGAEANFVGGVSVQALLFVNLAFERTAAGKLWFASSAIAMAGVEMRGSALWTASADVLSDIRAGTDLSLPSAVCTFELPSLMGLAPSSTAWAGWGLHITSAVGLPQFKRFRGFLTQLTTSQVATVADVQWVLIGGSLISSGNADDGFWNVRMNSRVIVEAFDTALPFLVAAVGTTNRSCAIRVQGGSSFGATGLEVVITAFGSAIAACGNESATSRALQAGVVSLLSSCSLTGVYAAIVAMTGGRVYWDSVPTVGGTMTAGQAIITQSSLGGAAVVSTTVAGLADGSVIANPDLGGSRIGRIT